MRKRRVALGRREGGGRLVHDQDAGVERERLGDLDELLLADPQAADAGLGVEVDAEAGEQRAGRRRPSRGGRGRGRRGSGSRPRKMLAATLSSGTRLSSWWMMAMPAASASRTPAKRTGAPSIRISPSSAVLDAGEDLHQRGLAGAVLAHQGVDLAGAEVEVDAVEGGHAGEALGDAAGAQQRPRRRCPPCWSCQPHPSQSAAAPSCRRVDNRQARASGARRSRKARSALAIRIRIALASPADGRTFQGG